jgi:signal transduction histidine kinase
MVVGRNSLRWRLPFSYALIALIAALSLAGVLLLALHSSYQEQERRYLLGNARTISSAMQLADKYHVPPEAVQAQIETFSFITQTRVRLLDAQRTMVADSGLPIQQALTLRYDEQDNGDNPVWLLGAFFGGIRDTAPAPEQKVVLSIPAAGGLYGFDLDDRATPVVRRSAQRLTAPIVDAQGAVLGYVELSEGPAYGQDIILRVAWELLTAASVAVVLAAGLGGLISRRISAPVVALAETTLQMTRGDLSARAVVDRRDELGVLAHAFNQMAARMEVTITTLRIFVSDAAHELHTPLTALRTDLELAADDPVQRAAHLERALEQMRRLEGLTANLLNLSRLEAGMPEERHPVDVSRVIAELSEVYASRAEQAGAMFQLELPDARMIIQGYEVSLHQAVGNLLDNAIKFTPAGGQVHVSLYQHDGWLMIVVKDSGIGIPAEDLPHLFRRFHRGRNAAAYPGSGLGLAITHSIIQAHGGMIEVQSSGEGTCVRILLK